MKSLTRVLSYLKPHSPYVFATLGLAIVTTLLDLVPPWLIKIIVDQLVDSNAAEAASVDSGLEWLVAGLVFTYFARNFSNHKRIILNNKVEQRIVFDIRSQLYRAVQKLSLSFFENRSTGELMSRINDDVTYVERIFIDGVEQALTAVLTLVGITVILFYLHWKLAIAALIPIPLLVYGAWKYTVKAHSQYHVVRKSAARMNSFLQDSISGVRETFSFNRQSHEIKRFEERSQEYCNGTLEVMRLWSYYSPSMMFLGSLGTAFILWYGIGLVGAGEISVGTLVAFIGYLALFYTPINQLHSVNHMLQHALASAERLFDILDQKPDIVDAPNAYLPSANCQGKISFDKVSFSYIPEKQTLNNISFEIQAGEQIALAGHTGSGKSTIVKLLMRFYDPQAGSIRIDGHPIKDLKLSYLREQIGLVSQDPFLFNGTVAENISYGNVEASREEIVQAAQAAGAEAFIANLPNGYDTRVGERGVKLSGGEKHRIAIARIFLKNPPIIVLDEATASIDTQTEAIIKQALETLMSGRTTFVIAHRLSTLERCTRIIVLKEGQLIESGSHEELIAGPSEYASLFKDQVYL
ncbi:MAG: ABC transporter ATP-binding protein [Candidatus Nitrohelix vancouverensis]|uniref:ABC transporter ATP-binding protein n=1 Tax=Candidatus Nitrohelix vancouverensis TaxID=2705534 RepID=A0A7T0C528_9BACT|nr:MAG: ABC transporter ATP-binding protein [Candidatus Nitrohelix vancouverensis]